MSNICCVSIFKGVKKVSDLHNESFKSKSSWTEPWRGIFNQFVLSEQQSKPWRYFIYTDVKQRKAGNPHIGEALFFFLCLKTLKRRSKKFLSLKETVDEISCFLQCFTAWNKDESLPTSWKINTLVWHETLTLLLLLNVALGAAQRIWWSWCAWLFIIIIKAIEFN